MRHGQGLFWVWFHFHCLETHLIEVAALLTPPSMVVILPQGLPGIFCFSTHFFVAPCLVELLSVWLVAANCERQWCYLLIVVEKRRLVLVLPPSSDLEDCS